MKIAVIGAGAVGGYYGALLAKRGCDVHFLFHSDFDHVRQNGLLVESVNGDFVLKDLNAYGSPLDMPLCDMGIVALKTTSNNALKHILPHALKPDATIVVLQNGLGAEAEMAEILPDATIIGGLCFLCANKVGPGHVKHLDYGSIRMGQYRKDGGAAGITDHLKAVRDLFDKAGVPVDVAEDLGRARWEKLVWNIPFNGLSVILNGDTSHLINSDSARSLIRGLMLEVIAGGRSCGHDISDDFADLMIQATRQMVAYKPSMQLDYEAKRPMEIEAIYRNPVNAAAESGYVMEKCTVVMMMLAHLDQDGKSAA